MTRLGVRSRINRTLLLVFTLALAAGVALTAVALVRSVRKLNRYATAEGFLRDLKDGRFAHAYQRLCSHEPMESEASFVSRLQRASASGRGLRSYEYTIPFDRESLSAHTALGTATFADRSKGDITVELARLHSGICVAGWRLDPVVGSLG